MISKDGRRWFSKEEDQWLIDNHANYKNWREVTEAFNEHFATNYEYRLKVETKNGKKSDIRPVANRAKKLGLKLKRIDTVYGFTKEEDEFLKKHAANESSVDLVEMLYSEFGRRHCKQAINRHVRCELGIHKGYGFQSDKSLERIGKKPIGTISWSDKNGYTIKVADYGDKRDWYPYGRYLWEEAHGEKLPKDWQVIYLDDDRRNTSLENLLAISKIDNMYLMNNKGYGKGEITRAWVTYGRLKQAVKERKEPCAK